MKAMNHCPYKSFEKSLPVTQNEYKLRVPSHKAGKWRTEYSCTEHQWSLFEFGTDIRSDEPVIENLSL